MKREGTYTPVKVILLIVVLLFLAALAVNLVFAFIALHESITVSALFFFVGVLIYFGIAVFLPIPTRIYVFGHELTHALAILLCGGKVHAFKVSAKGGMITTDTANAFVALAPYFFPVYTLFLFTLYNVVDLFFPLTSFAGAYYMLLGVTYAFHIVCNFAFARSYQPDLQEEGVFFSLVMIIFANVIVVTLLMRLMFRDFSLFVFYKETGVFLFENVKAFVLWVTLLNRG